MSPVDFGVLGMVAYVGVDAVGEVEGRAADGQVQDLPLGRQHVNVLAQVVLHHVLGKLRVVLAVVLGLLHHLTEPAGALVHLRLDRPPLLVHPVSGHAVFRGLVHLMGADLHLEGDAVLVHEGGVQRPVQVGLGHGDIVLEPARQGLPLGVDDAQSGVAVVHRVHDDADGDEVVYLADAGVVPLHLAVGGPEMLGAAGELGVDACLLHELLHALHGGAEELQPLLLLAGDQASDALVFLGHQVLEGQVL